MGVQGCYWHRVSRGAGILLNILQCTELSSLKDNSTKVEKPWVRMAKHLVIKEIHFSPCGRRRVALKSGRSPNLIDRLEKQAGGIITEKPTAHQGNSEKVSSTWQVGWRDQPVGTSWA